MYNTAAHVVVNCKYFKSKILFKSKISGLQPALHNCLDFLFPSYVKDCVLKCFRKRLGLKSRIELVTEIPWDMVEKLSKTNIVFLFPHKSDKYTFSMHYTISLITLQI